MASIKTHIVLNKKENLVLINKQMFAVCYETVVNSIRICLLVLIDLLFTKI